MYIVLLKLGTSNYTKYYIHSMIYNCIENLTVDRMKSSNLSHSQRIIRLNKACLQQVKNVLPTRSRVLSNLVIRNVLIRNKLVLRNHFPWPIVNLLHKDKEHLALRNNFRVTKKFLITKFDCTRSFDGTGSASNSAKIWRGRGKYLPFPLVSSALLLIWYCGEIYSQTWW